MIEIANFQWPLPPAALSLLLPLACGAEPASKPVAPSALIPAPGSPYSIGGEAADLALGDLDGDGEGDLVVVGGDAVAVLRGDGERGFGGARRTGLPAGSEPHLVALGDLDGDGRLDAAVAAHDSNAVILLKGDGEGGFAPFPGSPVPTGSPEPPHNHGLGLADLDGDDDLDLLFGNQGAGTVAVLLGDGHGGFSPAAGSPVAAGTWPYPFAVGDVDGDGAPDLAVSDLRGEGVTLLRGDGGGGFAPFPSSPVPTLPSPFHVALADLNGDGHLDLVVSHNDSARLSIRLGDGKGGFRKAPAAEMGVGAWKIAVADLDGDGILDLAGGTRQNRVQILRGRGDGTFERGPSLETGAGAWTVAAADLDGDGKPDLAALGAEEGTVSVWLQR